MVVVGVRVSSCVIRLEKALICFKVQFIICSIIGQYYVFTFTLGN